MDTSKLKKFAQYARRYLMEQVAGKMKFVLAADSSARRENQKAVDELERKIRATSQEQVIDKVAYIWFNRFCAIRFMDANRYTRIGILSPAEGQTQPEILAEAKMGHIDEELMPDASMQKVFNLLNGSVPSRDPQAEAYHLLVVAACNYYNRTMPFMFEKISDYTELLIPDDLLSGNSILASVREALTPDICQDVEAIGWLYQFYISEKKDEVFEGLKKNIKITPENIPAATQLFTPDWIVRYLVENSLGRLWMLNRPNSRLVEEMDYFIKPETAETDFLRISKPEEIKICDPACGSGHMLTYSYDLLYSIYEEEGYDANDIPRLILEKNLFGIEIDERAGELAAFALTMKAAKGNPKGDSSNFRRFFRKPMQPNICILQNILFEDGELKSYMDAVGRDLFTFNLQTMLHQFREADNFGSLIKLEYADAATVVRKVEEKNLSSDLFLQNTHERVLLALKQADYLSTKYHVLVANPPYMGKGMNDRLKVFAQENYPDSKTDLFAMFIERGLEFTLKYGEIGMVTMQSWMSLSSFESLRKKILKLSHISSLIQIGFNSFPELNSKFALASAFILRNSQQGSFGIYYDLNDAPLSADKEKVFLDKKAHSACYLTDQRSFDKIPGSPISYWVSDRMRQLFNNQLLESITISDGQNKTGNNDKFVREHWEISRESIGKNKRWFFYAKGGGFRRWYGNIDEVVDWSDVARQHYRKDNVCRIIPEYLWYKVGITWGLISLIPSFRYLPEDATFDVGGSSVFFHSDNNINYVLGILNTKLASNILKICNPTLNIQVRNIREIPYFQIDQRQKVELNVIKAMQLSKVDWDSHENSWDFLSLPIINHSNLRTTLKMAYSLQRSQGKETTQTLKSLEEENNLTFIDAYGLQDELSPDLPLNEITLTCNPHYCYGNDKNEEELENLMLADTMRELISYAVGCMFGRYSLDKLGLILANQGETSEDYFASVPDPTFEPDADNVIPILDEGWFIDDITERFRKFLKVTFGEENYEENLAFLEEAIGKDIRKYFLKDFYTDHLKRYKKRPIYWLFSSSKGSFNALIYMHRYRPDTVSVVLNDYLREFRTKLSARKEHLEQVSISASASPKEKTQALKDLEKLRKVIDELDEYEREILYPLATKQISIDLDDGVKVNYLKFGEALKKIPGLDAGEE